MLTFGQELSDVDHIVGMIKRHIIPGYDVRQHILRMRGEEKSKKIMTGALGKARADNDCLRVYSADRMNRSFPGLKKLLGTPIPELRMIRLIPNIPMEKLQPFGVSFPYQFLDQLLPFGPVSSVTRSET